MSLFFWKENNSENLTPFNVTNATVGGIEHVCFIKMAGRHMLFSLEKIVLKITTNVVQNVCYFNLFGYMKNVIQ